MALLKPLSPYVQNVRTIYPANFYSRPALPPWYQGMQGFGQARSYANQQFEYTMRQMAVSPFSVNSPAYMERIRQETGIQNTGLYEAFGTVGGVVGAGVGALLGAGLLRRPRALEQSKGLVWTGKPNPKRTTVHNVWYQKLHSIQDYNAKIDTHDQAVVRLNTLQDSVKQMPTDLVDVSKQYNTILTNKETLTSQLEDLQAQYTKLKYRRKTNLKRLSVEKDIRNTTEKLIEVNKNLDDLVQSADQVGDYVKTAELLKDIDKASDAIRMSSDAIDTAADGLRALNVSLDATKVGTKLSTKLAGALPYVGLAGDVAGVGMSAAGLKQSIQADDPLNTILNSIALAGDVTSVVGDVLEFTPLMPVGTVVSIIGGLVSAGVSAVQGFLLGETVGHSLSPEGLYAQKLFAENLYSSAIQRPITTAAMVATKILIPAMLNRLAGVKDTSMLTNLGLRWVGRQLTDNAIGNQIRAGVSMMALQGISSITSKLDDQLPWAPESPEDINFVSAISLYGDFQDNVYGATRNKSILVGLASGDPNAMVETMARSWGRSDDIYKSVAFDDVREAAGIDLTPVGNSLVSVLGEILIDPQNYAEVAQKLSLDRVVTSAAYLLNKSCDISTNKALMAGEGIKGTLEELVDSNGVLFGLPSAQRAKLLERFFTSYIEQGKEGLQKDYNSFIMERGKGSYGPKQKYHTVLTHVGNQFDILVESFDNILKGTFKFLGASTDDKAKLVSNLKAYETIVNKIEKKIDLTEEEQKFRNKFYSTYAFLEKSYGVEDTSAFVKSIIEDFDLTLSSEHVLKLYNNFTQLQDHMNITDFVAKTIINTTNPVDYLAMKSINSTRKFFEHLRNSAASISKKAKTIIRFNEALKNQSKIIKASEITKIYNENFKEENSVKNILDSSYKHNAELNEIIYPEAKIKLEAAEQKYVENQQIILNATQQLQDYEKKLEEQQYIHVPTTTEFDNGDTIYVNKDNIAQHENVIKEYEEGDNKEPLTRQQINSKYKRDISNADPEIRKVAQNYDKTYKAVTDYKYHNIYYDSLKVLMARLHSYITILDTVSLAEHTEFTNVLKTITLLKTFINSRTPIKRADKLAIDIARVEKLKKKHGDNVTELKSEIEALKILLETAIGENRLEFDDKLIKAKKSLENAEKNLAKYTKEEEELAIQASKVKPDDTTYVYTYDSYNWDVLEEQTLDKLDIVLKRYGINVAVFDENGKRLPSDGLKNTIQIIKTKKDLSVHLEYKQTINRIIQGIIFNRLPITDTEILLQSITKMPDAFTKKKWLSLSTKERFDALRNYLNELPFNEDILMYLGSETISEMLAKINRAMLREDVRVQPVSLEDVDDTDLRMVVMSNIYNTKGGNKKVQRIVESALGQLKLAAEDYNKLLADPNLNENPEFLNVLHNLITRVNFHLVSNPAYQFFQAYFYPDFKASDKSVNIFMSPYAKTELIPAPVTKKQKEDIKKSKTDYTEVELLNAYAEARASSHVYKRIQEQWEHIKDTSDAETKISKQKVITETVNERRETRKAEKTRVKNIKAHVADSSKTRLKSVPNFDEVSLNQINTFRVHETLTKNSLLKIPYYKNRHLKKLPVLKRQLLIDIINGKVTQLGLDRITFEFVPSKYLVADAKKLKDYYTVLEENKRTAPAHRTHLKYLANQLLSLEQKKVITIDKNSLVELKKYEYESDTDLLIRRIITTYEKEKYIRVQEVIDKQTSYKLSKLFKTAVFKAATDYMYDNSEENALYAIKKDYYSEDVTQFLDILTHDTTIDSKVLYDISIKIIDSAIKIFNQKIVEGIYTKQQYKFKQFSEDLLDNEQKDISAISERHYTLATDVAIKLIAGDPRTYKLVNDAISLSEVTDFTEDKEYETTIFDLVHFLNKYIATGRKRKLDLNINSITDVRYDATKESIIFEIGTERVSLFDLMFVYNHNIYTILNVIQHIGIVQAKKRTSIANIKEINARTLSLYNAYMDTYGEFLSESAFNISKELFIETYGKESADDYDFLIDYNNVSVFNRLSLDSILTTDIRDFTPYDGFEGIVYERNKDNYKNFPIFMNEHTVRLYRKSLRDINKEDLHVTYKGKRVTPTTANELFLLRLLEADEKIISTEDKRKVIQNTFFPEQDTKVGHGKASKTELDKLEEKIVTYKERLTRAKTKESAQKIENIITKLTLLRDGYLKQHDKIVNHDLNTPEKIYDYILKQDGETILTIYNNRIKTSSGAYIYAQDDRNPDLYYLVEHRNASGEKNVIDKTKGVPAYNYIIGEEVFKVNNPSSSVYKKGVQFMKDSLFCHEILGVMDQDYTVEAFTKDSIVISTGNPNKFRNSQESLLQHLQTQSSVKHLYIFSKQQVEDIKEMAENNNYEVLPNCIVKRTEDGEIVGLVPNIINVKGSKVKADKYMNDLGVISEASMHQRLSVNKIVENMQRYAQLFQEKVIVHKSFVKSVDFNKSDVFKQFIQQAKVTKAFIEFIELVDPSKELSDINLQKLSELFFRNIYIRRQSDGSLFNVMNDELLLKNINNTAWRAQLKTIIINNTTLLEAVKTALKTLQERYSETDVYYSYQDVLTPEFRDTLKGLKQKVYTLFSQMAKTQSNIMHNVLPSYLKKQRQNLITGYTLEELRGRRTITKEITKPLYDPKAPNEYSTYILSPYYNIKERDKIINELFRYFKSKDSDKHNYTNEALMYGMLSRSRTQHASRTKAINDSRKKHKRRNLDLKLFWYAFKQKKAARDKSTDAIQSNKLVAVHSPYVFEILDATKFEPLKKFAHKVYPVLQPIISDHDRARREDNKNLAIQIYNQYLGFLDNTGFRISNADEYYQFIMFNLFESYLNKIGAEIMPVSDDVLVANLSQKFMHLPQEEAVKALQEALDQEWAKKISYKIKPEYRTKTVYYTDENSQQLSKEYTIEQYKAHELFSKYIDLDDEDVTLLNNTLVDIYNYFEEILFGKNDIKIPDTVEDFILRNDFKTVDEYISTLPKHQQEPTRYLAALLIFKDENVDPAQYGLTSASDESIVVDAPEFSLKIMYDILKKGRSIGFKSSKEVFDLSTTPILDHDKGFKKFVSDTYFKINGTPEQVHRAKAYLKMFGIKNDPQINLFKADNKQTMAEIVYSLAYTISKEQMFALVSILNFLKEQYLTKEVFKGRKWHWYEAFAEDTTKRLKRNISKIRGIDATKVFKKDQYNIFNNNILQNLNDDVEYMFQHLAYVRDYNQKLGAVVIPRDNTPKEVFDLNAQYVTTTEANPMTQTKHWARERYKYLFKKSHTTSTDSEIRLQFERAFGEPILDIMAESDANAINEVASQNKVYNTLRKIYTEVMKIIRTRHLPNQFVKMLDIATAFESLSKNPKALWYYSNLLDMFVSDIGSSKVTEKYKKAVNEIVEYFNKSNYLVDMQDTFIKATLGYILQTRFEFKNLDTTDLTNKILEYSKKQLDVEHFQKLEHYKAIAYQLNSSDDTKEIIKILYGKEEADLDELERATIDAILSLKKAIKAGLKIDPDRLIDTYINMIRVREDAAYTDIIQPKTLRGSLEEELTQLDNELKSYNRSQGQRARHYGTIEEATQSLKMYYTRLDSLQSELKEHEDAKQGLIDAIRKFQRVAKLKLVYNNPDILLKYIEGRHVRYEEDLEGKINKRLSIENSYPKVVIGEYYRREEIYKAHRDLFDSDSFSLFKKIRTEIVHSNDLLNAATVHKEELDRLGIKNIHTWYAEMKKAIERVDKEQAELQKNILLKDDAGKEYYYKSAIKGFHTKIQEVNDELEFLEQEYNLYLPRSVEDIDDDFKIKKANEYLTTISSNLHSNVKDAFKILFKQHTFADTLTAQQIKNLEPSIQEATSKHEAKFKNYYLPRLQKINFSIKDIHSALAYLETATEQYKKVLDQSERVKINFKTTIKELGDTEEVKDRLVDVYVNIRLQIYLDSKKVNRADLKKETLDGLKKLFKKDVKNKKVAISILHSIKSFLNNSIDADHSFTYRDSSDATLQTLVNNIALETYSRKVYKRYKYFTNLFMYITNLNDKIKNNNNLLDAIKEHLESDLKVTEEQVLLKTITETLEEFGHQIYPDMDIPMFLEYMMNDALKIKSNSKLNEIDEAIKEVKEDMRLIKDSIKPRVIYTETNPEKIAAIKERIKKVESSLFSMHETETALQDKYDAKYKSISNLGTYKILHPEKIKDPLSGEDLSDNIIIENIIKESADLYDGDLAGLQDKLNEASATEDGATRLHNSLVDDLITLHNYLKQCSKMGKAPASNFIVFDMETYKDEFNNDVPYQIAIIKYRTINGKPRIELLNLYFNSPIFFDGYTFDADGNKVPNKLLSKFYKQQQDMMIKDDDVLRLKRDQGLLTKEDLDMLNKRTDALVKKVSGYPNNVAFIETLLTELTTPSKDPIIAHNGAEFDLPNFNLFISNIAKRLLPNMYYQVIKDNSPKKIKERFEGSILNVLTSDKFDAELLKLYNEGIHKILIKYQNGELLNQTEIDLFDQFNNAIFDVERRQVIKNIETELGFIVDEDLKKEVGDKQTEVKELVHEYIKAVDDPAKRKQYKDKLITVFKQRFKNTLTPEDLSEIYKFVEELLNNTEADYDALKQGQMLLNYSTFINETRHGVLTQQLKLPSEPKSSEGLNAADVLNNYLNVITQIKETIKYLKKSGVDLDESLITMKNEIEGLKDAIGTHEKEIVKHLEERETLVADKEKVFKTILDNATEINHKINNLMYRSNKYVNSYIDKLVADNGNLASRRYNTNLLRLQMEDHLELMKDILISIKNAMDILASKTDFENIDDIKNALKTLKLEGAVLNVRTEKEREKYLKQYITQRDKLATYIKQIEVQDPEGTDEFKNLIRDKLAITKTNYKNYIEQISLEIEKLWNSPESVTVLGLDAITIEDKFDYDFYYNLYMKLVKKKEHKDNDTYKNLIYLTSSNSKFMTALMTYNREDLETFSSSIVNTLLIKGIQNDIKHINNNIDYLENLKLQDHLTNEKLSYKYIQKAFTDYLLKLDIIKDADNYIANDDIFNILLQRGKSSDNMSEQEFKDLANTEVPSEKLEALEDPKVKVAHENPLKNDDRWARMLDPERFYRDDYVSYDDKGEESTRVTITVYDEENDAVQQFWFYKEKPSIVTFNLSYNYTVYGKELTPRKVIPKPFTNKVYTGDGYYHSYKNLDVEEYLNEFFWDPHKNVDKGIVKGLSKDMILRDAENKDASYESIAKLMRFYKKYAAAFNKKQTTSQQETMDALLADSISSQGLPLSTLKFVNITERIKNKFHKHLDVLQTVKGNRDFLDTFYVYYGIINKLLGKLNALVPGKILDMIHSDYSTNYVITYDDETLFKNKIDLINVSEGSAGSSSSRHTRLTTNTRFRHSTNPLRSAINNPRLYGTYTGIGIINDLWEQNKNLDIPVQNYAYLLNDKNEFFKQVLIQNYDGDKRVDVFTPNILDPDTYKDYKENILHKLGINLQLTFANDPRAIEDTILMDADDAKVLVWDLGNKTWLGLFYGFKGSIEYIKGLRKMYGTTFVANANSIQSRGAYGVLPEMAVNVIRKYLNAPELKSLDVNKATKEQLKDVHIKYGITKDALEMLQTHDAQIKKVFTIEDGKVIQDANTDNEKLLLEVFGESALSSPVIYDVKTKGNWFKLITMKPTNPDYIFIKKQNQGYVPYMVDKDIYRGEVYVILDSEHIASHMANQSEVDEYGHGISYVRKDLKGSVENGPVFSPSLAYTVAAKGVDWTKLFPKDTKVIEMHAEMINFGIRTILSRNEVLNADGTIDFFQTVQKVKQEVSSDVAKYVQEYLKTKMILESSYDTTTQQWAKIKLREIDTQVKQHALEAITGTHGSYYQSNFRKHEGIRQQLVADINKGQGEISTSKRGWDALSKTHNNTWLQEDNVADGTLTQEEWLALVEGFDPIFEIVDGKVVITPRYKLKGTHTIVFDDQEILNDYVEYLHSIGIVDEFFNIKENRLRFTKRARQYGYVMAARSPVQDYNAVPILKVIGYNSGSATQANAYLYKLIGGDNDGDTIGMLALSKNQYRPLHHIGDTEDPFEDLRALDATLDDYYDAGYIDGINNSDLTYLSLPNINKIDLRYAFVGKKTFGKARENEFRRFNWHEIYSLVFGDSVEEYISHISTPKDAKKLLSVFNGNSPQAMAYKKMYLSSVIGSLTGGQNELTGREELNEQKYVFTDKDYGDINKVNTMFNNFKDQAVQRYFFDIEIYKNRSEFKPLEHLTKNDLLHLQTGFSNDDKKTVNANIDAILNGTHPDSLQIKEKILFNKIYSKFLQNTITRIQASKRGINTFGGARKGVLQSALLSTLIDANKDSTGDIWNQFRDSTIDSAPITVSSLAKGLLLESIILKLDTLPSYTYEEFMQDTSSKLYKHPFSQRDLNKILKTIFKMYKNVQQTKVALTSFADALMDYKPEKLVNHFAAEHSRVKGNDPLIKFLLKRIQGSDENDQKLNGVDIEILKEIYFGSFQKEANAFFDIIKNKQVSKLKPFIHNLSQQYIQQHVIDRRQFNITSRDANEILSLSKHKGANIDTTIFSKAYYRKVRTQAAQNSVRHFSISEDDHDLIVSMGLAKDRFKTEGIKFSDENFYKEYKKLFPDYTPPKIPEYYNVQSAKSNATRNLNNLIEDVAKVNLMGSAYIPDEIYKQVEKDILNICDIINKTHEDSIIKKVSIRKCLDYSVEGQPTFEASIKNLLRHNIPSYRMIKFFNEAFTNYKAINNIYFSSTGHILSTDTNKYISKGLLFYELLNYFSTVQQRADLKKDFKDNKYILDFFLNTADVDPNLLVVDEETGEIGQLQTTKYLRDLLVVPRGTEQEAISNLYAATDTLPIRDDILKEYEKDAFLRTINELELISASKPQALEDTINKLKAAFISFNNIYGSKNKYIQEAIESGVKTKEELEVSILNAHIYNPTNVSEFITQITESNNEYLNIQKRLKELEYTINKLKNQIRAKNISIEALQVQSEYFEGLDNKQAILSKLETLQARYTEMYDKLERNISDYAFNKHFKNGALLLSSFDGRSIQNIYKNRPKILTQGTVEQLKNHNLLNMDKYQTPFKYMLDIYAIKDNNGNVIGYDWDTMYKVYKENNRLLRLTIVMNPFEDETLIKKLHHILRKTDEEDYKGKAYNELSKFQKSLPWNYAKHKRATRFKDVEDLKEYFKDLNADTQEEIILKNLQKEVIFQGKTYTKATTTLKLDQYISPTLKEIDIRSAAELKEVGEFVLKNPDYMIGFSDLNSILSAMEQAYIPYQFEGHFAYTIAKLQQAQKLIMRLNPTFLLRNLFDTYIQLWSEQYNRGGLHGMIANRKELLKYFSTTFEIYDIYRSLSEERIMTLTHLDNLLVNIELIFQSYDKQGINNITADDFNIIKSNVQTIKDAVDTYVKNADDLTASNTATGRIKGRKGSAEDISNSLENIIQSINSFETQGLLGNIENIRNKPELQNALKFLLNINFAEYYLMFDSLVLDAQQTNKHRTRIDKIIERHKKHGDIEDFKHILFEISAFMNTHAQIDIYKQETYKYLYEINEVRKSELDGTEELDYLAVKQLLDTAKDENASNLYKVTLGWNTGKVYGAYTYLNEYIENVGRINGYLHDRFLNGFNYTEAVNNSLRRFFNYGQRSPLEMQLLTDVPYLSFPIRSIDNWLERLLSPAYIKLMSDIIDGIYAQFEDEDGQYDEFTNFQIQNGWVPIGNNFGIRFGHGALDIQNLLSDPTEVVSQRTNPLLKGIQTLTTGGSFTDAMKQLATVGLLTRALNTFGPRQTLQQTSVVNQYVSPKPRSIGTTIGITYDFYNYNKYTPYKYRYPKNGRYARYENIYKDWFNKYGRMRKPRIDPLSLVKDIQWKEYVRWRRANNF